MNIYIVILYVAELLLFCFYVFLLLESSSLVCGDSLCGSILMGVYVYISSIFTLPFEIIRRAFSCFSGCLVYLLHVSVCVVGI